MIEKSYIYHAHLCLFHISTCVQVAQYISCVLVFVSHEYLRAGCPIYIMCTCVQVAHAKKISNYELAAVYRHQANQFIMQSKGLQVRAKSRTKSRAKSRTKSTGEGSGNESAYSPSSEGSDTSDDNRSPHKRRRKQKGVVTESTKKKTKRTGGTRPEDEAAAARAYLCFHCIRTCVCKHVYLCFQKIRTCVFTQVGAAVSLSHSNQLLQKTCLWHTKRNSPTINLPPLPCTCSWNVCLRFVYLFTCVCTCVLLLPCVLVCNAGLHKTVEYAR